MKRRIWQFLVKLSTVGSAILFVILARGSAGFADEASCVRELFDLPGKKRCD